MIQGSPDPGWRKRYNAIGTEEWARGAREDASAEEREAYEAARSAAAFPAADGEPS